MYLKRLRDLREIMIIHKDILNIKQQQYSRYELGEFDIPLPYLIKLAKLYNVSLDYIVELINEKTTIK